MNFEIYPESKEIVMKKCNCKYQGTIKGPGTKPNYYPWVTFYTCSKCFGLVGEPKFKEGVPLW